MQKHLYRLFIIAITFSASVCFADYKKISCVMHVHTSYTKPGAPTADEIAKKAKQCGIDAVIMTDKDLVKIEYGIRPLSGIIKRTRSLDSVLSKDPAEYLRLLNKAQVDNPGVIIIPGVESAPFYYWVGNGIMNKLKLCGWNKHLIAVGMENAQDYAQLPVLSNPNAGKFNPLVLWPLFLFISAILIKNRLPMASLTLCGLAVLFILNNYPFRYLPFDQYSGEIGEKPYQDYIDYVKKKGGLTFWAHPEAPNFETPSYIEKVEVSTRKYPQSILNTFGYTGFAIFSEGYREAGNPGGYWDQALVEYCEGKRSEPVWAAGETDYGDSTSFDLDAIQNILFVNEKSLHSILDAFRKGRYYTTWFSNKNGFLFDDFSVSSGKDTAVFGQEIRRNGPVRIRFKISSNKNTERKISIKIIKQGNVIKIFDAVTPIEIAYDDETASDSTVFYRIYAEGDLSRLAANPVL